MPGIWDQGFNPVPGRYEDMRMGRNKCRLNPSTMEWDLSGLETNWSGRYIIFGWLRSTKWNVVTWDPQIAGTGYDQHGFCTIPSTAPIRIRTNYWYLMYRLQPFLSKKALLKLTHALVSSWFDYCNVFYTDFPLKATWMLKDQGCRGSRWYEDILLTLISKL